MKKNQEKKIPLERQMRWDPGRKKYIQVGKWMKEQAKEKAKRKKHE
jgi:hypothetical protein